MALRMRKTHQYISLAAMAAVIAAGGAYLMLKPEPQVAAAPMTESVLCVPNSCGSSPTVQDLTLRVDTSINPDAWRIIEGAHPANGGDAQEQVLEIARQRNHVMQQVEVGIYITENLYNYMSAAHPYYLRFQNRTCWENDKPAWAVTAINPTTGSTATLANYSFEAASGASRTRAETFCNTPDSMTNNVTRFNLASVKSLFADYDGGKSLKYVKVRVAMTGNTDLSEDSRKNVRFRMQIDNTCPPGVTCHKYIAMVAVGAGQPMARNLALSVRNPNNDPVTTSSGQAGRDGYDSTVFDPTIPSTSRQGLIRDYVEFGLPCNATTAQSRDIYLYDINDGVAPATVNGWVGGTDLTGVVLQRYDEVNSRWVLLPDAVYSNGDVTVRHYNSGNEPRGGASYMLSSNPNVGSISQRNHYLFSLGSSYPNPEWVIRPLSEEKSTTVVALRMQPNTRYRFAITPVSPVNFMAFGLPTDQIYGIVGCESAKLVPSVTGGGNLAAGNPATFTNSIANPVASTATATGVDWYSYSFVVRRGGSYTAPSSFPSPSTFNFANRNATCNALGSVLPCTERHSATPIGSIGPGGVHNPGNTVVGPDITAGLSVGDRVCSFLAINPSVFPRVDPSWATSSVACFTIVAQPKVHIWGNDLRVGSSFPNGSLYRSSIAAGAFTSRDGSAVEYSITTPSYVSLLASQSGAFAGTTAAQSAWSQLTFANTTAGGIACQPSGFGCFAPAASLGTIPGIQAGVTQLAGLNRDAGGLAVDAGRIRTLSGVADLRHFNRSVSITTTGNITINENIEYDNPGNADAIPQLILIGNNITIAEGVTRVDAWLVASGTVSTCNIPQGASLTSDVCDQPLVINGPIMASRLALNRTYNQASDPQTPAEKINLRGDAYIWASNQLKRNGSWQTVYTTELPPRY